MTTAKKIEALRQKARKLGWRSPEHQAAMSEIRRLVTMAAEVEPRPPEVILLPSHGRRNYRTVTTEPTK